MRSALITGITGQDGYFLAELLLHKGYQVSGFARSQETLHTAQLPDNVQMFFGDIAEEADITAAIQQTRPDEIYNLASQSRPGESWAHAAKTLCVNSLGAIRLFEAVRTVCPTAKVYHASSSEMFGQTSISPQNEETPFNPTNPYAASKVYSHQMVRIYRESYGLFIASGILFNHESELRPLHFVTQKVAYGAACAALGVMDSPDRNERGLPIVSQGKLALGNFEIARDWGYAPDYVRAMWLMLQQDEPADFVIGTGQLHTLRELCEVAYHYVGKDWRKHVISDQALVRPLETTQTVADPSKAQRLLGWKPSVNFEEMIQRMVQVQIKQLSQALDLKSAVEL
ncbi:GDP-mannose 4,6-dehydratase [Legionella micdadei]|uniref:GDP-mannose 4,6-dehydratase n=1 Tax=Legionella micdadei TaxID=451 RepID=A0A098GK11_LEGMI|nr:GDP-mannose 4,6-dehydratase [Legionella micdadei]ARG98727.1 GDP-mannose 4,6-dehydratase [Legionella micdadei]ARH01446.1 GDP-mannose 4,6-dehydratase [Legionella micdadei]KTD28945.1 GDP-mannose 4,6-dehydratase [Legionella micdadei]NSL17157.1 GDP-mannose 4,6-dehydratase [Legionella micdadei]CEG62327.1 GDP-mannose 4,6-dehydratase [Legionella micdadei]